jgi:dipeptidyl aminopeptidase/acylaminoacyl peptidase
MQRSILTIATLASFGVLPAHGQSAGRTGRAMTVTDLVQLASFGSQPRGYTPADVDVPSPDGRLHAVVVKRGRIADNTNVFSLLLFHTDQLFDHPRPDTLVTWASSSNRPGIGSVHWLSDNRTVLFLGERPGERPQVYALDIQTRKIAARTRHATEITHFDVALGGEPVVYTAKPVVDTSDYGLMRARGFAVRPGQFVGDLLVGAWTDAASEWSSKKLAQTFIAHVASPSRVEAQLPGPLYRECDASSIAIAPTGRVALIQCTRANTPAAWRGYTDSYVAKLLAQGATLAEFAILDLERGSVAPLVDAPIIGPSVRWAPTGRSVVLANAFLPLAGVDSAEWGRRAAHAAIAEVDVATGTLTVIAHRDSMDVVAWDSASNVVDFVPGQYAMGKLDGPRVRYQKTTRGWREVTGGRVTSRPVLVVEQGINQPPRLVAVNRASKRRAIVFDPNPELAELRLGREEVVHWTTRSGDVRYGGLYYPPDFTKGQRYPLVIQTHGFDSTAWAPDGIFPTATAAQSMAAAGMLVLQIGAASDNTWIHVADIASPSEGPHAMEEIEGAIDHLDSLGLIERSRMGLAGFSRTCYHVLYLLTHSTYPIAAAALTDGVDLSYLQYLLFQNARLGVGQTLDEYGAMNGGPPWGKTFETWHERAPGFNLDRVTAALRLEAIGLHSVLSEWEPYASLLLQHRPVELYVIPEGEHLLVKPWERLASSGGNLDWFRFWLKGEEDPDSAKAQQYSRWRKLRTLQGQKAMKASPTAP